MELRLPASRPCVQAARPGPSLRAVEARGGNGEERHGQDAGQRSIMVAVLQGRSDGSWRPGVIPRGGGSAMAPPSNSHRLEWSPPSMNWCGRDSDGARGIRVSLP